MFRFINWAKVMMRKTGYLVFRPQALWIERCEEVRAHTWAREMAKKAK